jgi:hypothetical protein
MTNPPAIQFGITYHIFNRETIGITLSSKSATTVLPATHSRYIPPVAATYPITCCATIFTCWVRIKTPDEQESHGKIYQISIPDDLQHQEPQPAFRQPVQRLYESDKQEPSTNRQSLRKPFERIEVTTQSQLLHLVAYIHRNPQKHG